MSLSILVSRVCRMIYWLTGLKKSPIHLATMSASMIGTPNVMSPVHSMIITVKLRVIRVAPPRFAAAPTSAYFAMFVPWVHSAIRRGCTIQAVKTTTAQFGPCLRIEMQRDEELSENGVSHSQLTTGVYERRSSAGSETHTCKCQDRDEKALRLKLGVHTHYPSHFPHLWQ